MPCTGYKPLYASQPPLFQNQRYHTVNPTRAKSLVRRGVSDDAFRNRPIDRREAIRLKKGIGLGKRLAAEKAVVRRQR